MRIATATMYQLATQALLNQQAALAKTRDQIATGKRVQTPADDPVAAVQLHELARAQSQYEQYAKNSTAVNGRLQLEEQALVDVGTVLQRARELVVQANTATLNEGDRKSIATELKSRLDELTSIGNRKDANGEYLFGGYSTGTQPFARGASGSMQYLGDSGARRVEVDAGLQVQDSDPGSQLFMNIPAGNGLFANRASATNTGSGVIDAGSINSRAAWVPGSYTVSFTTPTTWQVSDGGGAVVASGNYSGSGSGGAIAFNGVQVGISGAPAAGDQFTVSSAGTQDAFSTLDGIITALQSGASGDAQRAQFNSALNGSLQQLDQAHNQLLDIRSQVGARLSTLEGGDSSRQTQLTDLQSAAGQLGDLDYAAAVSKMSQQYVGLQAAQQSFASIGKLSLFNYL
jgi:flagellar hook-associated protein 3 FlgL